MKKCFIGTCVENPFDDMGVLVNVVDNYSQEISKKEFLENCLVEEKLKELIKKYPNDFEFYKSKVWWNSKELTYFYRHSDIEYFYV